MLVQITKEMFGAGKKGFDEWSITEDKFRYREDCNIDLSRLNRDRVERLAVFLEKLGPDVRGAKMAARDCRNWVEAMKTGGGETKIRRVRQFVQLFRLYFVTNGKRHLYQKEDAAGVEAAMLAYYIVECKYHPKNDRNDAPEKCSVRLAYER